MTTPLTIVVTDHGPLHVRGPVTLTRKDGSIIGQLDEAWLCRCGHSGDKPHCDESHAGVAFASVPVTPWTGRPGEEAGTPAITVRPNGPYFVQAHARVVNQAGAVLAQGTRIVLCRCGASATKPFCDGTHKRTGFTAP